MKSEREFLVDRINEGGLVCGVSNGREDIPVGTTFTSVELRSSNEAVVPGSRIGVSLQLVEVHFYQRIVQAIPGGHSAGLGLLGSGAEALTAALAKATGGEHVFLLA